MTKLALIRHGQSAWNLENRFTGWWDADLTAQGEAEARNSGKLLADADADFRAGFTSVQTRAIRTLWLALTEMAMRSGSSSGASRRRTRLPSGSAASSA